jgi:hypothetical protein
MDKETLFRSAIGHVIEFGDVLESHNVSDGILVKPNVQVVIRDAGLPNLRTVNLISIITKKWSTLIYHNDPWFSTRRADCYLPISF